MIEKAAASGADEIVFDLEDAVATASKASARSLVTTAIGSLDFGRKIVAVRVNAATSSFCYLDLIEVVSGSGGTLDSVVLPKVDDASHVHFVAHLLAGVEQEVGIPENVGIELLIESARGAARLDEIATASDRVEAILFGPGDYAASLGIVQLHIGATDPRLPEQWAWVMSSIAAHAHAAGAVAVDGPYADIRDRKGFIESAQRASLLGFEGKWCIHPDQVPWANEAFSPTPEQLAEAEEILEAWRAATEQGKGAAAVDGRMIDEASRRMAESVTARARAAGL
jgi:citrate lyase beta subunit